VPQGIPTLAAAGEHFALGSSAGRLYRMRVSRGAAQPLVLPANDRVGFGNKDAQLYWSTGSQIRFLDIASGAETAPPLPLPSLLSAGQQINLRPRMDVIVVHLGGTRWESWRIDGGKVARVLPLESGPPRTTYRHINQSGTRIVFGYDQRARVWDLTTGKPAGPEMAFVAPVSSVLMLDSGERCTVATYLGVVSVMDVATGRPLAEMKGLRDVMVNTTRLGAKDTRIATKNTWGEVQIWNTGSGEPLSPVIAQSPNVNVHGFSPDGSLLLTHFARTAQLFDGITGLPGAAPMIHPTRINAASISGKRPQVATAADDGVRLWDAETARPVCEPMTVVGVRFATTASVSPNRRFVRSVGRMGTAGASEHFIWSLPPSAEPGAAVPEWLLDLAGVCASRVVDADDRFSDAPDAMGRLGAVRRTLAALPGDAPYAEWGRWFLSEDPERPIAPGFSITPAGARRLREELGAASSRTTPAKGGE
jgi:hypothetical protein